jgi:hypothetical protein
MNYVLLNCKYYDSSGASIHSGKSILVSGNTIKHIGQSASVYHWQILHQNCLI